MIFGHYVCKTVPVGQFHACSMCNNLCVNMYLFVLISYFQKLYNPKSEKVGTVWKTQIKKESSDF